MILEGKSPYVQDRRIRLTTGAGLSAHGTRWVALVGILFVLWTLSTRWVRAKVLWHIPGPRSYALSSIPLALNAWQARSIHTIHNLHKAYGPVVRVGPNQVSFNSLAALRTIFGAGSPFERTDFYRMFDAYGTPNLFTFASGQDHRERKKLLSHMYSNQTVLGSHYSPMVVNKVESFFAMLNREPTVASEIFSSLHYFSLDAISEFVYGQGYGATNALSGTPYDRHMIHDILDPSRRRMAWFAVHFPNYTRWITTQTGWIESVITKIGLLPMNKPFTYSGIRKHALDAFHSFKAAPQDIQIKRAETSVIGRLVKIQQTQGLSDLDIASECADHLLAGIDTTADSLMFLIWALSLPKHSGFQEKLREEVSHMSVNESGVPDPKALTQLPYLNAVLKESLRLYSPLPSFEPRTCPTDTVIDGFAIPAGTVVGMSPFCLHREETVFPDPLSFNPDRWLTAEGALLPESDTKNRFFWAFSSGARMCIGMHLANAEMLTLTATMYRKYRTHARRPDTSPGITSRFEIFSDETMSKMEEHECWIDFVEIGNNK